MNTIRFYGYFAAAFGSCWLLLFLLCAIVTQSRINLGEFGFLGPPAISAVCAYLRFKNNPRLEASIEKTGSWIDQQICKFRKREVNE